MILNQELLPQDFSATCSGTLVRRHGTQTTITERHPHDHYIITFDKFDEILEEEGHQYKLRTHSMTGSLKNKPIY
jgi:hypothetical protein